MIKKMKEIVSIILCFSIFVTSICFGAGADARSTNSKKVAYVDGKAFEYCIDDNGTVSVQSVDDGGKTKISIENNGKGTAYAFDDEEGRYVDYTLDVADLSKEKVDIKASHQNNKKVKINKHFNKVEQLVGEEYQGQAALVLAAGISLSTLLKVVLAVVGVIIISYITYTAVSTIIDKIRNNKPYYYFKAYIQDYVVYIDYSTGISQSQAASRIKSGQSIYTFTQSSAKGATTLAGMGVYGPEIHALSDRFTFYHYHTNPRNGSHALYGMPFIR